MKIENSSDSDSSFDCEVDSEKVAQIISKAQPQMNLRESDLEFGKDLVKIVGKCVVCHNIPAERVMECANCNSLYCDTCLPEKEGSIEVKNMLKCPKCKQNTKQNVKFNFYEESLQKSKKAMNRFLKQLTLDKLKFKHNCNKREEKQLQKILSYKEINAHFKEGCPSIKNFVCPLKCDTFELFFKEGLQIHLEKECPNMEVQCQGCGETSKREQFKKHETAMCLMNLKTKRVKQDAQISCLQSEIKIMEDEQRHQPMLDRGIEIVQRTFANRERAPPAPGSSLRRLIESRQQRILAQIRRDRQHLEQLTTDPDPQQLEIIEDRQRIREQQVQNTQDRIRRIETAIENFQDEITQLQRNND